MIKKISIIGSGNIATQLSLAFQKAGIEITQIVSRNKKSGKVLAKRLNSEFDDNIKNLLKTDLTIICVNDDNIINIANSLPDIAMVHTSGSTEMIVCKKKKNIGVLYPIQSFSKEIAVDFSQIPICIEANNKVFEKKIICLSQKISKKVLYLDSEQRKHLHLAAVIVSNFSNFCYLIAQKHLDNHNIDFALLNQLIQETAKKTINSNPVLNQTGPAKRGDRKIIKKHLAMLKDKNYKKIYKLLSENILSEYEK